MTFAQAEARVRRIYGSDAAGNPDNRYAGVTARVKTTGAVGALDHVVAVRDRRPGVAAQIANGLPVDYAATAGFDAVYAA